MPSARIVAAVGLLVILAIIATSKNSKPRYSTSTEGPSEEPPTAEPPLETASAEPSNKSDRDATEAEVWLRGSHMRFWRPTELGPCEARPAVHALGLTCSCKIQPKFIVVVEFVKPVRALALSCAECPQTPLLSPHVGGDGGPSRLWDVSLVLSSPCRNASWASRALFIDFRVEPGPLDNEPVCFQTIGDWGKPKLLMLRVAKQMAVTARKHFSKFMVSTGDNFYDVGVENEEDPQFETTFEQPFGTDVLRNVRWFVCAGNHDQWGLPGQVRYTQRSLRWYFPQLCYAETIYTTPNSCIRLIVLNSYGRIFNGQVRFLQAELERVSAQRRGPKACHPIILNHAPIFSGSMHGSNPKTVGPLIESVLPLMQQHNVHVYLGGDDHTLQILRNGTSDFFVSGAGGGASLYKATRINSTVFYTPEPTGGFMLHCINRQTMKTSVIDDSGKTLFAHTTQLDP